MKIQILPAACGRTSRGGASRGGRKLQWQRVGRERYDAWLKACEVRVKKVAKRYRHSKYGSQGELLAKPGGGGAARGPGQRGQRRLRRWCMPASTTFLLTVRKVCAMGLAGSKERGWTFDADAPADLRHVTALITGANSGTGLEAAKALASRGAHVVLGCRSRERGEAAVAQVREHAAAAGASGGSAVLELMDLADLASVRAAARRVEKAHGKSLNLLVNNAGVMAIPYERTGDGHERQWQTNVLGHHLLTGLLLKTLVKNRPSRVVAHASSAARGATSLVAAGAGAVDRPYRSSAGSWGRYNLTKVANIWQVSTRGRRAGRSRGLTFILSLKKIWQARVLAKKLKARGLEGEVLSLACQPGECSTASPVGPD